MYVFLKVRDCVLLIFAIFLMPRIIRLSFIQCPVKIIFDAVHTSRHNLTNF